MGDGNLSPNQLRTGRRSARFRMGHGAKQAAYLDWKVSLLGNIPHSEVFQRQGCRLRRLHSAARAGMSYAKSVYFGDGKKHLTWDYLKSLTPLALAVWYMDDGCFTVRSKGVQERTRGGTGRIEICVEAMSPGSRERLVQYLRDTHGLDVKLTSRGSTEGKRSPVHHCGIGEIPASSSLPMFTHRWNTSFSRSFRGKFAVKPEFVEPTATCQCPARVLDINVQDRTSAMMSRYDIEVEGSHNYLG